MKAKFFISILAVVGLVCSAGILTGCSTTKPKPEEEAEQVQEPSVEELMQRLDEAIEHIPTESRSDEPAYQEANVFQTTLYNGGVAITHYNGTEGTVVIPEKVNDMPVTALKPGAFAGNTAVKEIIVDAQNPLYSSANGVLFDKAGTTLLCYPSGKTGDSYAIPEQVMTVAEQAFAGSIAVAAVTIPAATTLIKDGAFSGCKNLAALEVNAANAAYRSEDGILYNKKGTALLVYPAGKPADSYVIPDTVIIIGNKAFAGCNAVSTINIPESVSNIGANAFYGATGLTALVVSEQNERYSSKDGILFDKDATVLLCYPAGKAGDYLIPEGVTAIRGGAFYGSLNLENITLSADLVSIGSSAFAGCVQLSSIIIPSGIQSIGAWTFYGCRNLTEIAIPSGMTSIENGAFYGCTSLSAVTIADSVTHIGEWAFAGCLALSTLDLPESITSIGRWAFARCKSLNTVNLPSGLTSINEWTFYDCSSLTAIALPSGLTKIKRQAFRGCSALNSLSIPDSVSIIEEKAFLTCLNLDAEVRKRIAQRFGAAVF
jgi:hypothetical protein